MNRYGSDEPRIQPSLLSARTPEEVKRWLDEGADPNMQDDEYFFSALHYVRDPESVRLLLAAGADPNSRTWKEEVPLDFHGNEECIRLLIYAGADPFLTTMKRDKSLYEKRPEIKKIYDEFKNSGK